MIRLLALGDSFTVGTSVTPDQSWPHQLAGAMAQEGLDMTPAVVATDGWTSSELLAGLQQASLQPPYDLVSVLIGVNDQYRHLPVADFAATATEILQSAGKLTGGRGAFAISIPDWSKTPFALEDRRIGIADQIDVFNEAWSNAATVAGVPLVDVTGISRRHPEAIAADGLHPSGDQYGLWVEAILPVVQTLLGKATVD